MIISTYAPTYARMGIPILALIPGDKFPVKEMKGWADTLPDKPYGEIATTDLAVLEQWDREFPNSNYALAAFPVVGSACFLEFDQGTLDELCKLHGRDPVRTRTHISGNHGLHCVFLHTAKSIEIGNRSATKDGHEWFSFRGANYYVVAPGSIHPNGNTYKVGRDVAPIPIPDWLTDLIESMTTVKRSVKPDTAIPVDEDFDSDDFFDHYGIEIRGVKDDVWSVPDVCPVSGYRHQNSFLTAFWNDGHSFGFHCFAAGCPGSSMTIGRLIEFMNRSHDPYLGPIWPKQTSIQILEQFGVEYDDEPSALNSSPSGNVGEVEIPGVKVNEFEDALNDYAEESNPDPLPIPSTVRLVDPDQHVGLDFPGKCAMYGRLEDLTLNFPAYPEGWLYPSLVVVGSSHNIKDIDGDVRSNLYGANLGDKGAGKSSSTKLAVRCFYSMVQGMLDDEDTVSISTPSSDRGLLNILDEEVVVNKLLWLDEMRGMMAKCAIPNSSLGNMICNLFDYSKVSSTDKKGGQAGYGKLSIIGNIKCADSSEFAQVFGKDTTSGLADRFLLGYSSGHVKYQRISVTPIRLDIKPVKIPDWAWEAKEAWAGDDVERRRMCEQILRIALVTSAINGDREVTKECFEAAMRFCEWQIRLRFYYRPGLGETPEAQCLEAVYSALFEQHEKQKATMIAPMRANKVMNTMKQEDRWQWIHFAKVINNKSYYRRFAGLIDRVKKSLVDNGIIQVIYEDQPSEGDGKTAKPKKEDATPFIVIKTILK